MAERVEKILKFNRCFRKGLPVSRSAHLPQRGGTGPLNLGVLGSRGREKARRLGEVEEKILSRLRKGAPR